MLGATGLGCALVLGGLGYAATFAVSTSAAPADTGPIAGTTLSSPASTTSAPPTAITPPHPTKSAPAVPGKAGSLSIRPAGGGKATLQWSRGTFASAATITADPDPALGVTITGARNQLVGVVAVTSAGSSVTAFKAPLGVVFSGSRRGYVPVVSADGRHFRALRRLPSPHLTGSQKDGYYVASGGRIQILTKHLTIFGVLSQENRSKWGDIARARTSPPALKILSPAVVGDSVHFTLSVDEPVALLLSAKAAGKTLQIGGESMIGKHRLGGAPAGTKQANIVVGGRYGVNLVFARAWQGRLTITLVAGDNSGNRTTKTVSISR